MIYKLETTKTISYHKPFANPLLLTSENKTTYYIAKCRPTYVGHLKHQQIKIAALKPHDFLVVLSSAKLKAITPTILDNIIIHLLSKSENMSLTEIQKHYQCTPSNLNRLCKTTLGMSFLQYQNILLNTT
ncbi:helix-turn-helix transcriptional regulator [Winogradskyella thalassocola]|nr:hypothetical protein [Winogradskyella thalassocola]